MDSKAASWRPSLGFGFWTAVVVLLAFLVREYFVLVSIVDIPIRGDIREYVVYAWNLWQHGVFSMAPPGPEVPLPDDYRNPGFPWLLALSMHLGGGEGWYPLALQFQILLGTATVWLTILLARCWLDRGWALFAGGLLALWPHHVAATGALLSEVLFGFALTAGLYCFATALSGSSRIRLVVSAIAFGFAYLVNPLIALFPPLLALLVWREKGRIPALSFIAIFLLPVLAFGLRNAQLDRGSTAAAAGPGRATMNFVQGSWSLYHAAWQWQRSGDPEAIAIIQRTNEEMTLLARDPRAGLAAMAKRMGRDPAYYLKWYVWDKPLLLWDWNIRIGRGGPYVLDVRNSPFETHPLLRLTARILQAINPLMTIVMLTTMVCLMLGGLRRKPWAPAAALAVAALACYLTGIHVVFQAEPRYANAYRSIEAVLVATALAWVIYLIRRKVGNPAGGNTPASRTLA